MSSNGYYRYPTIHNDNIIFVSEDDLWSVPVNGGIARRLTASKGLCSLPRLSPDGKQVAFVSTEEGNPEIYLMAAEGGEARRLTFLGAGVCLLSDWSADGNKLFFASDCRSPFSRVAQGYSLTVNQNGESNIPEPLNFGDLQTIAIADDGATALGRNANDPARWKRYKGGLAGDIWVDEKGQGSFKRLLTLSGNLVWPMWANKRIYFLSDHEGIGNIYSAKPDGTDIKQHTKHKDYFVRFPSTDSKNIVYTAGAELFLLNTKTDEVKKIDATVPAQPTQTVRKFQAVANHLEHFAPHPEGHSLSLISRGQPITMPFWEEAPIQHGIGSKVRYRLCEWMHDGKRFALVNDQAGFERIEIHTADQSHEPLVVLEEAIGRVTEMAPSPVNNLIAVTNHKQELIVIDVDKKSKRIIDSSASTRIFNIAWSPDGRWLAYSWSPFVNSSESEEDMRMAIIRIADLSTGNVHDVTELVHMDYAPCFDPSGKYLYFLSAREFNPVYDKHQFELSFPQAARPYLITLTKDLPSPFRAKPQAIGKDDPLKKEYDYQGSTNFNDTFGKNGKVEIDFDGISKRVLAFPVEIGHYRQLVAAQNRVLFTQFPVQGISREFDFMNKFPDKGRLIAYDFDSQRSACLQTEIDIIRLAADRSTLVYKSGINFRAINALSQLPDSGEPAADAKASASDRSRKSGWIDLDRAHVLVEPKEEWQQMYNEAWRLQREHFWSEDMSSVDWDLVHKRYQVLLARARTRGDISDLIWEMQGELGTSHCYEALGDYQLPPRYLQGFLGADFSFDHKLKGYRVECIIRGDSWDRGCDSPLAEPGINVEEGDVIVAVGGQKVSGACSLNQLLVNTADKNVALSLISSASGKLRQVIVKTLKEENSLRYRNWVESNRSFVHQYSEGRLGYLHIPDMGPWGFAEFHRSYLAELQYEGLVVDVRYNRGGHVSGLLLEKLARKRIGYCITRWGRPTPFPAESVAGPIVCITNQLAGSDGDIFTHCFKLNKIGPVVGKRTWGGVVGVNPTHSLVDGTVTTQPEYSFWFSDVGWSVENFGAVPDFDVDIAPQDYKQGRDTQLLKSLDLALQALAEHPVQMPDFSIRPSLKLPQAVLV